MGSFAVSCGLSNLAIHESDKVGFVLLEPPVFDMLDHRFSSDSGGRVYADYVTDNFAPFLPPIFGEYDDGGSLCEIEDSVTTKLIEQIFNRPIQVVVNCVGSQRSLYSKYNEINMAYASDEFKNTQWDATLEDVLLACGFVRTASSSRGYTFGSFLMVQDLDTTWSIYNQPEGEFATALVKGIADTGNGEGLLVAFSEATHVYPAFLPEDYASITKLHQMSGMLFLEEIFAGMVAQLNNVEGSDLPALHERRKVEWAKYMDFLGAVEPLFGELELELHYAPRILSQTITLPPADYRKLVVYADNDEFFLIDDLFNVAVLTNHPFAPTFCGSQDGDDEASIMLAKLALELLAVRKSKYSDEE